MNPKESDIMKDLIPGPFPRKNFTEAMKREVNRRIEMEPQARKPRFWVNAVALAAALLMLVALRFDWQAAQPLASDLTRLAATPDANSPVNAWANNPNHEIRDVLLLGFRTDATQETQIDTYRTLMIGMDNQKLSVAAQGDGILAPYGQKFWKLEMENVKSSQGFSRYAVAHPADQKTAVPAAERAGVKAGHIEKLLFVGNKYFSFSATDAAQPATNGSVSERVWTKEFNPAKTAGDPEKAHVRLQDVFGAALTGDSWSVIRGTGSWTAQTADPTGRRSTLTALTLPKELVAHDSLIASWGEIKGVQPDALDAVSSPDGDMVAVFTADRLYVYPYFGKLQGEPLLTVPLKTGEKMIMVHWANDKYAASWLESGKKYLK
jgi:hypothetical protein